MWTYATCCMSQPGDEAAIELHMFSPRQAEQIVLLLAATALYHRTSAKLGLGHTVNFGEPWLKESACSFGLISLPYLDGPPLENLLVEHAPVKCYWLLPITWDEREFKRMHGVEALERRFEAAALDYLNPIRSSVV